MSRLKRCVNFLKCIGHFLLELDFTVHAPMMNRKYYSIISTEIAGFFQQCATSMQDWNKIKHVFYGDFIIC
jgi:hypothetical protein